MDLNSDRPIISKIRQHLFLGNSSAARDVKILNDYKIERIVSATNELSQIPPTRFCINTNIARVIFPIVDGAFQDPNEELISFIFPWMRKAEKKGASILVHCGAGVSRSPSLVITYLVWCGIHFNIAVEKVSLSHELANPNPKVLSSFLNCINMPLPDSYRNWWQTV